MTDEEPILPHEEIDRVSRLASSGSRPPSEVDARNERLSARELPDTSDYIEPPVRSRSQTPRSTGNWQRAPRTIVTPNVSDDERIWAAVAHASAWITLFGGIVSIGAIIPLSIFIPLVIYFLFRKKSDYIAYHALQAFTLQLICTVGAALLLAVGGVVWGIGMVVSLLAVLLVVGFVLAPLWFLVGLALLGIVALLPLVMVFYGTVGAIESWRGRDYRYPLISRWIERQLSGSQYYYV